jgi:glycosyltransferase involved in cell wall biosynthesis
MRILHAFIFFSIRFAGGTCDLIYKLAKAQVRAGLNPIISTGDHQFDADLAGSLPGVEFWVEHSWLDRSGFSLMPGLGKRLRSNPRVDVVHMHVFRTFQNLSLYWHCKRNRIPYIMDAHGAVPYYKRKPIIKRLFDRLWGRRILREAAVLVAETEVGVQEYLDIDPTLERNRIVVLSPPFDTDEFVNLPERGRFRSEWSISPEENMIMFLGRIHQIKGNDFLIRGFAKLLERGVKARLVLVGPDNGHMEECKQLAKDLGAADHVLFTGFLYAEKKQSALVDADIVAQLSRQEQGAWAPFEAVLCGTPIVVTDHTGAGEDVKRIDAGWTVRFDDVEDLASRLQWMLSHRDETRSKTMQAKRHIEEKLSMNVRVHEYTDLYSKAIALCRNR